MKKLLAFALVLMLTFSLVACGGSSALVGKWVLVHGNTTLISFELSKDGTGKAHDRPITWTAKEGLLRLIYGKSADAEWGPYRYKISRSTLILDDRDEYKKE
jgi:hypothetical protein